ncbi:putative nacht and tpr domain protein [Rosellinia necatrix]|uniref:Putative nacht and tpr domain protein n=1 Tax=Rosellinia necatrix TaxID=77044 RepID=A0A1S8A6G6_ROSNE|nr:putative nacht and tpr domain protein [Rosellinia necatrix]
MDVEDYDLGPFWADAKRAYELECQHSIDLDGGPRDPQTVEQLLELIESRGAHFGTFRQKHGRLWSRLQRFAEPVVLVATLAGEGFSTLDGIGGGPVTSILKSITHLVSAAEHVTSAYDWIESVFSELQGFSDRLESHIKTTITRAMRRIIIAILAFNLRIIGRSELLIKRGRVREYLRVAFIGKDQKTKELLDDLNNIIANEGRLTLALTHEKAERARDLAAKSVDVGQEVNGMIDHLHEDVRQLAVLAREDAVAVQEIRTQQVSQHMLENMHHILHTGAVVQTDDWYSVFRRNLLDGSGAWLQKEEFFDLWMQHQAPILWVFGDPGAGKTILSTWLINMLNKKFEPISEISLNTHIGYFFIKENVGDLRHPNLLFKTMAWQIQQVDPLFRGHAAKVCEFNRKVAGAEDTWENLFLDFYRGNDRRAILIIDGLDEAELHAQRRILRLIKDYVSSIRTGQPARIQFAVFGRFTLRPELERI